MLFRSILWGSTSPRPSPPGEGESSAVAPQKHATGFAGCSFAKPEPCACCSFSLGEKVRMRAVPEEFCLTPKCEGCQTKFFGARPHPGPLLQERENHSPWHRKSTRLDVPDAHSQNQNRAPAVPSPWGRRLG